MSWTLLLVIFVNFSTISCAGTLEEICHFETFEANCDMGHVVFMEQASYGRMEIGKCAKQSFGFIGCLANVLHILDRKCTGRRSCSVEVIEPNFEGINPCNMELKSFLQAQYRCIPVPNLTEGNCVLRPSSEAVYLPSSLSTSTVISETSSDTIMCGSYSSPWVVRTHPGQRLNVTLLDLTWKPSSKQTQSQSYCNPYGTVREFKTEPIEGEVTHDICATEHQRLNHIYTSNGEEVELVMHNPGVEQFMIVIDAIGCPDLDASSPNTIVKYSNNRATATVRCRHGKQSWHIACEGNSWIGTIGNCSSSEKLPTISKGDTHREGRVFSTALLVVIVVAVSLLMCGSILLLGVFFYRRLNCQKKYSRAKPPPDEILMTSHKEGCLLDPCAQPPDLMQYDGQQAPIQCQIYHAVINECPYMRVMHPAANPNCENPDCDLQHCNTLVPPPSEAGTMIRHKDLPQPQLLQDSNPTYDTRREQPPVYFKYKYDETTDMNA